MGRIIDSKPQKEPPQALLDMFLGHEDYLAYGTFLEGMRVKGGRVLLGMRAGPSIIVDALLHEMAHLIEIDDARITSFGWGLRVPETKVHGRVCEDPKTYQASDREMRVIAIQWVLGELTGADPDVRNTVSALSFMPDWWCFRDFFKAPKKVVHGSEAWVDILYAEVQRRKELLRPEDIMAEWARKCALLSVHPDTGERGRKKAATERRVWGKNH